MIKPLMADHPKCRPLTIALSDCPAVPSYCSTTPPCGVMINAMMISTLVRAVSSRGASRGLSGEDLQRQGRVPLEVVTNGIAPEPIEVLVE